MRELFEKVSPIFSKFKNEKNVEIEMRLGKINRGSFDTNIGKETFDKILRALKKYQSWESVKRTSDMCYYYDKIRLTIDEDTEESNQIVKEKLTKVDHALSGSFDVRFSVSKEVPFEKEDIEYTSVRKRTRESFVRKNLSIDMTVVSGNPDDLDCEEEESYQIEFEIIDPRNVRDADTLYNILYKIQNVLNVIK